MNVCNSHIFAIAKLYVYIRIFNGSNWIDETWLDLICIYFVRLNRYRLCQPDESVQCSMFVYFCPHYSLFTSYECYGLGWLLVGVAFCLCLPEFSVCVCVDCEYGCSLFKVRVCLCVRYSYINMVFCFCSSSIKSAIKCAKRILAIQLHWILYKRKNMPTYRSIRFIVTHSTEIFHFHSHFFFFCWYR